MDTLFSRSWNILSVFSIKSLSNFSLSVSVDVSILKLFIRF